MLRIRFWGVRGSIPAPGPATAQVGGNTSCVEVRCGTDLVILDAGTGIRALGLSLAKESPVKGLLFFSHVHWDHIQGFPFFVPAFIPRNSFRLFGGRNVSGTIEETLSGQMNYPSFPVRLADMGAEILFHDLREGEAVDLPGGGRVTNARLNHPNGCYGYRIEHGGRSVVYATDTEHYAIVDPKLRKLAAGADVLIYDAMYTPEEYAGKTDGVPKTGWGHSTMDEGARIARELGVRRLVLFHHDPSQDDEAVAEKERRARVAFPETVAAREGLAIEI
ncbi:MAG: MBL fold metallo-hydrolase [Myxococcota bacterium]|nr:MBL fold metallo-hydrolase [Myxococcota bacterium]